MSTEALDLGQETRSPVLRFWDMQLGYARMVLETMSGMNQFLDPNKIGLQMLEELQRKLQSYDAEENLRPASLSHGLSNGTNPYHIFLEGQKARKLFFEMGLIQLKVIKSFFPVLPPLFQQVENYIRTNLAFTFTFDRPEWGLALEPTVVESLDFADIVKFEASPEKSNGRNMLLVAPMSGHFATLLRKTIESLHNAGYTVYITDWKSPFDVPKDKWAFTVDRYTTEVLNAFRVVEADGGTFDTLAVCQPSPETLTAITYAEMHGLSKPRSLTLMAGPIDVSQSPTKVNESGEKLDTNIIELLKLVIPEGKEAGSGRSVYPGAVQISGFMATKLEEHLANYRNLAFKTTPFTPEEEKQIAFYQEYFAVMDLPHEFYRDTVNRVFRGNEWAKGSVEYNGEIIDFSWMTSPLMTVEWDRDDICGIGQTEAAQKITNPKQSLHLLVEWAWHYGTFAGKLFREKYLPALDTFLREIEVANDANYQTKPTRKKA